MNKTKKIRIFKTLIFVGFVGICVDLMWVVTDVKSRFSYVGWLCLIAVIIGGLGWKNIKEK